MFDANTPTDTIINSLLEMEGEEKVARFADVPGQLLVDLNSADYLTSAPIKDDWKAGINHMNVRFSQNKVLVHPRCKFAIMSLESGTFNKNKTDFERTTALGHCDGLAALMYALRSRNVENPYGVTPRPMFMQGQMQRPQSEAPSLSKSVAPKNFGFKRKGFGSYK